MKRLLPLALVLGLAALAAWLLRPRADAPALRAPRSADGGGATTSAAPAGPAAPPRRAPAAPAAYRTAFERLIDALRAGDREAAKAALEDLRLAFVPDPVPDEENAALLYKEAFAELEETPFSEEEEALLDKGRADEPLTEEERRRLRAILGERRKVFDLLRRAADLPRSNFGVKYEEGAMAELPHVGPMIHCSKLLEVEARLGEGSGPAASARAALRMAEAVADEPVLVSQLVRGICHSIGACAVERAFEGEIPAEPLRGLFGAPAPERLREGMERSLFCELYMASKLVLDGAAAGLAPYGVQIPPPGDPRGVEGLARFGERLKDFGELVGRPYWESRDGLQALEAQAAAAGAENEWLARIMMPSMARAARQQAQGEAIVGAMRAAAALRLYRDAHGDYPQSLEALGTEPPLDPFTGRPLLYRREGSGFVIWSVGEDGLDGGGVSAEQDVRFRAER